MLTIGIVSEGITDQIVIETILQGHFNDSDLSIEPLQPTRDATDENLATSHGSWLKVFEYCASEVFRQALESMDHIIVHCDSDIFNSENIPKEHKISLNGSSTSVEIVAAVGRKLINIIGHTCYEKFQHKILFAISLGTTDCWLLPLFYEAMPAKANKITGCIEALNQALNTRNAGFIIDDKKPQFYRKASKGYRKHRDFRRLYPLNDSLRLFICEVDEKIKWRKAEDGNN